MNTNTSHVSAAHINKNSNTSEIESAVCYFLDILNEIENTICKKGENVSIKKYVTQAIQDVNKVKNRLEDPNFYLGIVGGFSSGKSTFVNAFIEGETLATDINQGTTCVGTYVLHGEEDRVIVTYNDGRKKSWPRKGLFWKVISLFGWKQEPLVDFIKKNTATEEISQNIRDVKFYTPAKGIKDNLVLVDTPGLGSTNSRHTEHATDIAHNECDALLVLTNLHQPLSLELTNFIKEITGDDISGCIFIGTFKDQLQETDLKRLTRFFEEKIKSIFGDVSPYFKFISAYQALVGLKTEHNSTAIEEFRELKKDIYNFLRPRREHLINKKIVQLISNTIKALNNDFATQKLEFLKETALLEQALIKLNKEALIELQTPLINEFKLESQRATIEVINEVDRLFSNLTDKISRAIFGTTSSRMLASYLKNDLSLEFNQVQSKLNDVINANFLESLKKICNRKLESYLSEISKRYSEIRNSSKTISYSNQIKNTTNVNNFNRTYNQAVTTAKEFKSEDLKTAGGLLIGGAVIGSMILPGIGTAVGAALGAVLSFFSSDLEDRQNDSFNQIKSSINSSKEQCIKNFKEQSTKICDSYKQALISNMNNEIYRAVKIIDDINQEKIKQINKLKELEQSISLYSEKLSGIIC